MRIVFFITFFIIQLQASFSPDLASKEYITQKHLKSSPKLQGFYFRNLKEEIFTRVKEKFRHETFAVALKKRKVLKNELDKVLTPLMQDEELMQIKIYWKISSNEDYRLYKRAMFESQNRKLFQKPLDGQESFWVADWFKVPLLNIAQSYDYRWRAAYMQEKNSYYKNNFPTLGKVATVMYNRHSFLDTIFVIILAFLYISINYFPIIASLLIILWLIPIRMELKASEDKSFYTFLGKLFITLLLAVLSLIVLYFLFTAFLDVIKVIVFTIVIIATAPLWLLGFLLSSGYYTDNFIFMGDATFSKIILELTHYKLVHEMGLNIDLNKELLWFIIKLFVLLFTSHRIFIIISFLISYVTKKKMVIFIGSMSGLLSIFYLVYYQNTEKMAVLFELFSKVYGGNI
ncbi:MAG: hypothetical protein Q9M43_15985 [Sulfurimonas sp.]|nr:hypothetical protein [Sulfurimonas sp.]